MNRKHYFLTVVLAALLLAGWSTVTLAATLVVSPQDISQRIENQHGRIRAGISKGALTRREADIVLDNLEWIEATAKRMKRDGLLTPQELGKMKSMLDRNSLMINKKTRNFDYVYWGNFEEKIRSQQQRIRDGVIKGRLTRREGDTVQGNLDWIRATFSRMKQDGRLRAREMMRLEEMLKQNSEMIYKKKHNQDYYIFRDRYKDFR